MTQSPSRGAVATVAVALVVAALVGGSAAALGADGTVEENSQSGAAAVSTPSAPNGTNATVMVAPRGPVDRFTSIAEIEQGREAGWVTPSPILATGDTLLLRLRLPGMAARVANATGDSADARFRSVLAGENVSLRLVERSVGPERSPHVFNLNESRGRTVVADPGNDTYYVAADLTAVPGDNGGLGPDDFRPVGEFVPKLVVDGEYWLNPGSAHEPNQTGRFELLDREASLSGADRYGDLTPGFAAAPNQTVEGYTTLAPGSTVTVLVTNATGIETPRRATARVTRETGKTSEYGSEKFAFESAVNLSGTTAGTEIGLVVASNGTVISDTYEWYRYWAPVDASSAAVDLPTDPILDGSIRVERATLPDGGFVTVERASDDTVVGSSGYLEPGTHEGLAVRISDHVADNATLRVTLAHDSDGDGQYFVSADRHYADSMRPAGATVSWNATAAAIEDPTPNATVLVAPSGKRDALSSRAAIQRAQRNGWLTPSDLLAKGDTFVLRLTAPDIADAVANESGSSDEARFRSFLARSNTSLLVSEKHPGPSYGRVSLYLDAANVTSVVADPDNDTYYVATDLMRLPWSSDYDEERSFSDPYLLDREEYVPRLVVDGADRLNPGDIGEPNQTGQFVVEAPEASVAVTNETAETVTLAPAPNQTVTGYANLAPGSDVTVRLSNGTGDPFPLTETVRVERERYRFRASFDLSGAAPNSSFEVQVRADGKALSDTYDGYVDPALASTPTPTANPTPTVGETATETATPTETITAPDTATATPTAERPTTADPTTDSPVSATSGDGPGFGPGTVLVASVLAALVGVVRVRRCDR